MTKIRIGFISFAHGHAGSYLQAALNHPDVEIVGIADEVASRVQSYVDQHQIAYYATAAELLEQKLDGVIICSENARHAEFTIQAADAGVHVLCEKPLGISEDQMLHMIETCKAKQVQLMTAFPCRYLTAVVEAKQAVDSGQIGEIIAIKGTNRGTMPQGWFLDKELAGGGALFDHTVHVMDLMHWFTGSKVKEVYARAETWFNPVDIDDSGLVHVTFENGVFAFLDTSWSRNKSFPTWGDVTMEIIGTKGTIYVDSFAQKNDLYSIEAGKGQWDFWGDNMDAGLVDSFIEAIRDHKPVPITGYDGYIAAQIALKAYESARAEKTLPMDWKA